MPRCALDHRFAVNDARKLRRLRNTVHVRAERDHRVALTPGRPPGTGDAGDLVIDGKAVCFQHARQVALGFEFLEPKLGKRKQAVDDFLGELGMAVHPFDGLGFQSARDLRLNILSQDTQG